jgi:hypothetical protein
MVVRPRTLVAAALALGALAPRPLPAQQFQMQKVELDFDKQVDFTAFKTYSWKDTEPAAKDPQMHTRIVWYVERELEKKGLKKAPDGEGQLLVRYYAKGRESFTGTPSQSDSYRPGGVGQLTTSVDFKKVLAGTLLVELQRATDGQAVWRAASEWSSIDKNQIDAETGRAVRLLLSKYPPPAP